MIISLSEIMTVKNKTEHIEAPIELEKFNLNGNEYEFAKKETVMLDLVSKKGRTVSLQAKTNLALRIPCSRCLEEVEVPFDIQITKELDFNETEDDRIKDLDESNFIDGYNLDVDLLIYDELLLNFPLQVLCCEDCKGICKVCGCNQNRENCDCDQAVADPRMSKIQDIFKNYKEV